MTSLSIDSAFKLASGNTMARLGFGVYKAKGSECESAVIEAIKAGYRHSESSTFLHQILRARVAEETDVVQSTALKHIETNPVSPRHPPHLFSPA